MRCLIKILFTLFVSATAMLAQAGALDAISAGDASAGVKEALSKGADYAVASLGKSGGFLGNDKVKIHLPGYLQKADSALRMFGMGKQADQLVETMNHAAENAVAVAKPVLVDAIKKMSVQDAKGILTGGDDSVTQYFKRTSTEQLTAKFMPIVKKDADIDSYVTQKAMDGLFLMIAEEEKKLRANPVGAGSDLLKKVFGAL